jgi:uncharacterized protein YeaO (DUF488 family)
MIRLKRAYDEVSEDDGVRFLVDRRWPRGVKKSELQVHEWARDAAPSDALRRWFAHDPAKWADFQRRYFAELDAHPEAWQSLAEAARHGRVTLVYGARDAERNNAVALKIYLEAHGRDRPGGSSRRG